MLVGLLALGVGGRGHADAWLPIGFMALLGIAYQWATRTPERYELIGSRIVSYIRGIDCALWVGLGFFQTFRADNLWLATIPLLSDSRQIDARSTRCLAPLAAASVITVGVSNQVHAISLSNLAVIAASLAATCAVSYLVMGMSTREDELQQRDRRFGAMISCSSALAGSRDLLSMLDQILRLAVEEVGGDCGYVMLVDEEQPNNLRTEVAYGVSGEFEMPLVARF